MIKHTIRPNLRLLPFATLIVGVSVLSIGCSNSKLVVAPPPPAKVAVKITNYCPSPNFQFIQAFGWNHSADYENQNWVNDTDRDLLNDTYETTKANMTKYNIGATTSDTNIDGYRDFVMARLQKDSSVQAALPTCYTGAQDTDHDGLTDCEENLIGTESLNPDTDGDGIPDGIELRMGLNPLDQADASIDSDKDGQNNIQEAMAYTPINESNSGQISSLSYSYKADTKNLKVANPGCMNMTVSNIPVMSVSNGNLIEIQFYERGQNGSPQLRFIKILIPQEVANGMRVVVDGVSNQTIDPRTTPLVIEPDSN